MVQRANPQATQKANEGVVGRPQLSGPPKHGLSAIRTLLMIGDYSPYGLAHLAPMLAAGFQVVGVVVASPDRWRRFRVQMAEGGPPPVGRSLRSRLRAWAVGTGLLPAGDDHIRRKVARMVAQYRIPLLVEDDVNSETFLDGLHRLRPDLIMAAAYPQIFREPLLAVPPLGIVNFHPSLLPRFRGAHPHFWALRTGATESGITVHLLTAGLDEGPIIDQMPLSLEGLDYDGFYDLLKARTPEVVSRVAAYFDAPVRQPARPQFEGDATTFTADTDLHHRIFWALQDATEVVNVVRAGRAFCFFRNDRLEIARASASSTCRNLRTPVPVPAGTIVAINQGALWVKAQEGFIEVTALKVRGRTISAEEWVKRLRPAIGEVLT